jgi:hypothetical protein
MKKSNTIATHGEAQEDEEEAVKYQRAGTAHSSQKQCVITEAMFRQRSGDACKYTDTRRLAVHTGARTGSVSRLTPTYG